MALSKATFSTNCVPSEVLFFFDVGVDHGSVMYQCRKCPAQPKQAWKTGYSNLRKHLMSCIGHDYMDMFKETKRGQANRLGFECKKYISNRELSVFRWIEWLVMRDMPLSEVDYPLTRSICRLDNVCSNSILLYITKLVPLVELVIKKKLPVFFGIMFDGWTDVSTHYIAIIATFMEDGVYYEILLGCSPPLNEKTYTAEEHYALLEAVLANYGKSISSPSVLIGDNCSTNKALADLMGIPLIGCGCHKLNLAVKAYLARRPAIEKTIARIDKAVSQLRNLKAAGALRDLTPLTPIKRNVTRWSSTHKMLERFLRIEGHARQLDDIDPVRRSDLERVKDVMPALSNFKSVMTDLQRNGQHIGAVRETSSLMTEDYPELKDYLAADAAISHNPLFESAVVKVINGKQDNLTVEEKATLSVFLVRAPSSEPATAENSAKRSYASQLRERKRQRTTVSEVYADLRFIAGTSASVERLFSSAKHVLRSTRKRLTPVNFEKLLFLKHNRHLWDAEMVAQAMKTTSSEDA